ncbi:MAG: hypothetical protein JO236_14370 [Mycobacterium sp.]|uniref:hypothetical protein n=1 Tax=Mycobacterium sp. TaxID=1785 RepID=UPI001EB3D467|nr:hypothetical protein [Mycobacterium sp.]MBW0018712.1 hypothetical protein [Mycobacterium sp.]
MSEDIPQGSDAAPQRDRRLGRVGSVSVDWWATLLAGVITALAVADVLPKIPW